MTHSGDLGWQLGGNKNHPFNGIASYVRHGWKVPKGEAWNVSKTNSAENSSLGDLEPCVQTVEALDYGVLFFWCTRVGNRCVYKSMHPGLNEFKAHFSALSSNCDIHCTVALWSDCDIHCTVALWSDCDIHCTVALWSDCDIHCTVALWSDCDIHCTLTLWSDCDIHCTLTLWSDCDIHCTLTYSELCCQHSLPFAVFTK